PSPSGRPAVSPAAAAARPRPPRPPAGITTLSVSVPGRARLRVAALRRRPELRRGMEATLSRHAGIHAVHARTLTGSTLGRFDPARMPLGNLMGEVARAARRKPNGTAERRLAPTSPAGRSSNGVAWHALDPLEVQRRLDTSTDRGLSKTEVERRLATHGVNRLPEPRP